MNFMDICGYVDHPKHSDQAAQAVAGGFRAMDDELMQWLLTQTQSALEANLT
jgi:hypothetical protein